MRLKSGLLLLVALTLGAGNAPNPQKNELAKFAGKWTVSKLVYDGDDQSSLLFHFVFKGDEASLEGEDGVKTEYARIKIKLDPSTTPKIMDITVSGGIQKGAAIEGIYEFKGDELRICAKVFGKERPGAFASESGSSVALLVLKRAAP